jgi:hypothetical protein
MALFVNSIEIFRVFRAVSKIQLRKSGNFTAGENLRKMSRVRLSLSYF